VRLPQPGGPGSRIHIPQEQGGPVIPQALGYVETDYNYAKRCGMYYIESIIYYHRVKGASKGNTECKERRKRTERKDEKRSFERLSARSI
jgi:hypothetical protein